MCVIKIIKSILGSTTLMVNSCDNISTLRQASIHPEAVTSWWKQTDLISRLYDVYHSIEYGMLLVHIYGHQDSGKLVPNLTPLAYLKIQLNALVTQIMASFLLSPATRNTIAVGFSDTYGLPSVSISGVPVHSILAQSIAYKISKRRILQYWDDRNLNYMADWEWIDLK